MHGRIPLRPEADARETEQKGFDFRQILNFAWRNWVLLTAFAALGLGVGAVNYMSQVPTYTASADILLDPARDKNPGKDSNYQEPVTVAGLENELSILRSAGLLKRVVEKQRLIQDPQFGGRPATTDQVSAQRAAEEVATPDFDLGISDTFRNAYVALRRLGNEYFGFFIARDFEPAPVPQKDGISPDVLQAVNVLRGSMRVQRSGLSTILTVFVTSTDPNKASRLANAIADAFVLEKLDARFESAKRASGWLSDRLTDLREELRASEEAVAQFRQENGLVRGGGVTLNEQQVAELNGKLVAARAERAEKKSRLDLFEELKARGGNAEGLPDVRSETLSRLRGQDVDAARREAELVARYNDRHPGVVNVRAERRDIQRSIRAEIVKLSEQVATEYELAKGREESIQQVLRDATGLAGEDNLTAIKLRELERTAAVNKSLFEDFLQRAKITQEQSTFELRDARVITPATPPGAPSGPVRNRLLMMGLAGGLVLGVGAAFARERLRLGFVTPAQIEQYLHLPLLASINRMRDAETTVDGEVLSLPMFVKAKPLSRFSESFRMLRSGIQMSDVDHPAKVIQVTSTLPNEGKTTIALSFAVSAANSGQRVLFIDADLRHPSSSRFFGLEKAPGLVDLLLGESRAEEAIQFDEATGIWVLPAGSRTQSPAELLGSERTKALIGACRATYDLVVVDTAPVGPVVDPVVVSRIVDKVVYTVQWGTTAREMVERCIGQLAGPDKVAGVVFNMINPRQVKKYGSYDYHYYYGKNYHKNYYAD